jgi:DNA helicase IV
MAGDLEATPASDIHPDHDVEQAYLHHARAALDAMIERSERALKFSDRAVQEENTFESRIVRAHIADRRVAVDVGSVNLCFGRIDEDPDESLGSDPERWYVGRRHIEDAASEPVVVDWRAPVAIPFYRATAADAQGLALRRRFSCEGDELLAIFDEHLDDPESVTAMGIPDPVLAEIERGRSGEMADIVATIAAEQDEIIRAPISECLLVQGGPGTGKTAVGLHRGAFLLFEHREALSRSHVLVIGPNRVFLRYVANVLPSLGETAVTQATITSLLSSRVRVRGIDSPDVAEVKGRLEMVDVIRRIAVSRIRPPKDPARLPVGLRVVTIEPDAAEVAQKTALAAALPLKDAKGVYAEVLLREVRRQLVDRSVDAEELQRAIPEVRRSEEFRKLLHGTWPGFSAAMVVRLLLGNRRAREQAIEGLVSADDAALIHRGSAKKIADEPWSEADLALLDEAGALTTGAGRVYGHVVVDEAQDLSAMALRAAARRAKGGSMTILGDLGQATGVGAQTGWGPLAAALGVDAAAVRRTELTVGYRVPGPILEFANRLLPITAPDVTPSTSIRQRGRQPELYRVDPSSIVATVRTLVDDLSGDWSTVGIVAPAALVDPILVELADAGVEVADTRAAVALDKPVSVLEPATAKGLEFDATIVVEPARFADLPNGLRLLYVALTRAVQRLAVVHSEPLPAPLAVDPGADPGS